MRSILVVEDNTLVYDTISDAFALRGGFTVAHAANGSLALAALESSQHDLALIDVGLPFGPSGFEYPFPVLAKPFRVAELVARFDEVVAEAYRLNRLMREQISQNREMRAQRKVASDDFSLAWVEICSKLLR